MKTIFTYTKMMFILVMTVMTLASCDEDRDLAYDLEGVWQGTITGNYYSYRGYASNDYDTEIMFRQPDSWSKGGDGYEIDYNYETRRYTKVYFDWVVRDGKIILRYDDGQKVIIRDFETYYVGSRMRFRGYFDNFDTGEHLAAFNLVKVESPEEYYDNIR